MVSAGRVLRGTGRLVRGFHLAPGRRAGHAVDRLVGGRAARYRAHSRRGSSATVRRGMASGHGAGGNGWWEWGDGQMAQRGNELAARATEDRLAGGRVSHGSHRGGQETHREY